MKQIKEDIGTNHLKEKSEKNSNDINTDSPQITETKKEMPNIVDSPPNDSKNKNLKKSHVTTIKKKYLCPIH